MGNSESSSSGANNNQQEKEEESKGISLSDMGKAAAVAAAGIAALAIGAHQILSSLPSQREEEGLDVSSGRDVHWEPPPDGWLKINTDFSAERGVGYVIRDHLGNIEFAEAMILSEPTTDSTRGEANTIYDTLVAARSLCLRGRSLILESDNEPIVNLLTKAAEPRTAMKEIVERISQKIKTFEPPIKEVKYVDRKANRVANHLAKEAAKGRAWHYQPGLLLPAILRQLRDDDCEAAGLGTPY